MSGLSPVLVCYGLFGWCRSLIWGNGNDGNEITSAELESYLEEYSEESPRDNGNTNGKESPQHDGNTDGKNNFDRDIRSRTHL